MRTFVVLSVNISLKTIESKRAKFFASSKKAKDLVDIIIDKLPKAYYDYIDLFLRRIAKELLPRRLGLDYEIKLIPSAYPLFKRPYPMSAAENKVVKH